MMKIKTLLLFTSFFFLSISFSCSIDLKNLNQNTTKRCSECEIFLKEDKVYDATYREYDGGLQPFYSLDHLKAPNKFKVKRKANYMDYNDWQKVLKYTFCFNGMNKAEVESKFDKSLDKYSGSLGGKIIEEWETTYNFKVGALNKDGEICLISGNIHFYYEIIKGDTLYRQMPSDVYSLKKCLDAEGVIYKE